MLIRYSLLTLVLACVLSCANIGPRITVKTETTGRIKRIAVLPFTDAPNAEAAYSGGVLSSAVIERLVGVKDVVIVEQEYIKEIVRKKQLKASDFTDRKLASKIGRLTGADAVITGAVSEYITTDLPMFIGASMLNYDRYKVGLNLCLINVHNEQIYFSASHQDSSFGSYENAAHKALDPMLNLIIQMIRHKDTAVPLIADSIQGNGKPQVRISQQQLYDKPLMTETASLKVEISQKWAIIIGLSKYQYQNKNGLTNLLYADDDAKAFAESLINLGWSDSHIKLLVNKKATKRNIEIALESWLTKTHPNDMIVLFWSGYGFPDPEEPDKVYFACYDTDICIPATGYRMDKVRMALEERRVRNVVVLADTCHAGELITRDNKSISILPYIEKKHRDKSIPKGWIFMIGADTERQAIKHTSWSNRAFTHCLIKGLSGQADGYLSAGPEDGIVTMGELRAYLNFVMPDETQKLLGVAKRPVIITKSSGDPDIWELNLKAK
jgi:hypothetical protein